MPFRNVCSWVRHLQRTGDAVRPFVSCPSWVLGIEFKSFPYMVHILGHWAISSGPLWTSLPQYFLKLVYSRAAIRSFPRMALVPLLSSLNGPHVSFYVTDVCWKLVIWTVTLKFRTSFWVITDNFTLDPIWLLRICMIFDFLKIFINSAPSSTKWITWENGVTVLSFQISTITLFSCVWPNCS